MPSIRSINRGGAGVLPSSDSSEDACAPGTEAAASVEDMGLTLADKTAQSELSDDAQATSYPVVAAVGLLSEEDDFDAIRGIRSRTTARGGAGGGGAGGCASGGLLEMLLPLPLALALALMFSLEEEDDVRY